MFFTRKKLILRCLATFTISCLNPVAGAIVGIGNAVLCYRDIKLDQGIAQVAAMPVVQEAFQRIAKGEHYE